MRAMEKTDKVEKRESIEEIDQNEDSLSTFKFLIKHTFNFLIAIITGLFTLMNSQKGIQWGFLALLELITLSHASPIAENDATSHTSLDTLINSLGPNPSFIMYSVKTLEANSFITRLNEVQQEEFYGIQSACEAIPIQHEICLAHPASSQSTKMNTINFEKAIRKHSHSLHSLK